MFFKKLRFFQPWPSQCLIQNFGIGGKRVEVGSGEWAQLFHPPKKKIVKNFMHK